MSEEKLYAVKNDDGEYWDFDCAGFWRLWRRETPGCYAITSKKGAEIIVNKHGGHVATLIEKPEKPVLHKEVADEINFAKSIADVMFDEYIVRELIRSDYKDSATNKMIQSPDVPNAIEVLLNAWNNGYTVAKEKKYYVKVPYTEGWHFHKYSSASKLGARNNWIPFPAKDSDSHMRIELFQFTESEIEHYGLQDCEKEEVTDDEND